MMKWAIMKWEMTQIGNGEMEYDEMGKDERNSNL